MKKNIDGYALEWHIWVSVSLMLISDSLEAVVSEHTLNVGKENYHHEKWQALIRFTRVQMEVAPA